MRMITHTCITYAMESGTLVLMFIWIHFCIITLFAIHLFFSRLPPWAKSFLPSIFVTETAWNFYPYTITGLYSFLLVVVSYIWWSVPWGVAMECVAMWLVWYSNVYTMRIMLTFLLPCYEKLIHVFFCKFHMSSW